MSVQVKQLTKIYGTQKAVDGISFDIPEGAIVGLLGPNGAGKSTTMKILTGFIPQTSGMATVHGLDVEKNSLEIRRLTGYLPESNPLYLDMYVQEYLHYAAGFYEVNDPAKRVKQMLEMTGLGVEQHKKIGQLSKGYRQRVGLAQAMLHDPKVLILDEPTSGLDPNQLVDIRALIKEIGKSKTIILSTHIMQEVEAMCERVLIINKGKLVANDAVAQLQRKVAGGITVQVEFSDAVQQRELRSLSGIQEVRNEQGNQWLVTGDAKTDVRKTLFDYAVRSGKTVLSMSQHENSLEEIFRELTQKP
ncbi:MAG: gliding motility-associated ABC transporter ATP-binding subunit GldA [Sphingobacteriaceae bacterium]|nr:gliding motility-associated ABC transporter ATP-binding subunit GldA [Sphingobacteriaceae bacterium]